MSLLVPVRQMTPSDDRELRQAFSRFDRSTAYGCAHRGRAFDLSTCRQLWTEYQDLMERVTGCPPMPFPGSSA